MIKAAFSLKLILPLCSLLILSTACDSWPHLSTGPDNQISQEDRHKQDAQKKIDREKANDDRQAADSARRSRERQRDEARQLREKFERYSTPELKLMHERYLQVANGAGGRDLNVTVNRLFPSESDKKQMDRVVELERELLRRWKAGDEEARLPNFEK
jgi:hypothetical protein